MGDNDRDCTQGVIVGAIQQAFKSNSYVSLEAPTGVGKSWIGYKVAENYDSYVILSPRLYLQEQYNRDFPALFDYRGKGNYTCPINSLSCSTCLAEKAKNYKSYLKNNCKNGLACPYLKKQAEARYHPEVITNFEALLYGNVFGAGWVPKELLIVDEAHNLESRARGVFSMEIPEYIDSVEEAKLHIRGDLDGTRLGEKERNRCIKYLSMLEEFEEDFMVHEGSLFPLNMLGLLDKYLFSLFNRVLFMSATLPKMSLNRIIKDYSHIEYKRPLGGTTLVVSYMGSMSMNALDRTLPLVAARVNSIVLETEGRGIIHTHSFRIAGLLESLLSNPSILWHRRDDDLDDLLERHHNHPDSWLATPSLGEGYDGRGDMCRHIIVTKAPYPPLGDPIIASLSKEEYMSQTLTSLGQMLGRGTREEGDSCQVYLLDSSIRNLINHVHLGPAWLRTLVKRG